MLTSRDAASEGHQAFQNFQPSYASSKGKWVSLFLKTMPSEIGFPMTLTSEAFVNKKRNKQTSHDLQNDLEAAVFQFVNRKSRSCKSKKPI